MRLSTVGSLAAAASLVLAPLAVAPSASAAEGTAPVPAAGYLATQLTASEHRLTTTFSGTAYDDLGLTLDAVMSLTAAKSADTEASASMDYVLANAASYYSYGDDVYANATAKLLTAASVRGLDPRAVGGVDLVSQLQGLETADGQFKDRSGYGDYSNTLGQAFGLIGLKRAGVNPSPASVDYLLAQQCDDGGFSLEYKDGCISDPDATSLAIQALTAVGGHDEQIATAADYLEGKQGDDGGLGGGTTTEGVNSNSTGLAAVAFRLAGRDDALASARGYLEGLTFDCSYTNLAGGIAYDQAGFDTASAEGTDAPANDQVTRTTAQALLGFTDASYVDASPEGATAETVVDVCEEPTEEPTGPVIEDDGAGESGGDSSGTPERPAVVQTDSGRSSGTGAVLGLGVLVAMGTGLVLTTRRPGGAHR